MNDWSIDFGGCASYHSLGPICEQTRKGKRLAWNRIPRFFLTDDLAVGEVTNMFLKLSIVHLKPY